jgi:hypothetical protein
MKGLTEGKHFYYNEEGLVVLTAVYHLEKGYCCGNGCKHCPYDFESVPEPRRSQLVQEKQSSPSRSSSQQPQ